MATLTVWRFPSATGAAAAQQTLERLQEQDLITVHDAAIVFWEEGKKKPKTRQLENVTRSATLSGAFWGLLFGLIFFMPLLGVAVGAASGALGGSLADVGIDDDFIADVRRQVTPGTSALFVLTSDAVRDQVRAAFTGQSMELIQSNLSSEEEARLRHAFSDDEPDVDAQPG